MGSTFTTFSGQKVKGFAGKEYSVPVFLQFVPGYCAQAVHSVESFGYKGDQTINSIYAVSHIPNTTGKRRQQSFSEDNRYFPLLRNHGDVPSKGDPVLLCTIGKINYYLGPLNTINNSPTWNDDKNYKKMKTHDKMDVLDRHKNNTINENDYDTLTDEMVQYFDNNMNTIFKKDRDLKIGYAIVDLMKQREEIENFNKKAIYILIREMTDVETAHITSVVNVLKKHYKKLINKFYKTGTIIYDTSGSFF